MPGSSIIAQNLLPFRSGEIQQRPGAVKAADTSFASVLEQKVQTRQERPAANAKKAEGNAPREGAQEKPSAERTEETKASTAKETEKNPAEEKLKEIRKKLKETLKAIADGEKSPEDLEKLVSTLQDLMVQLQQLVEEPTAVAVGTVTEGEAPQAAEADEVQASVSALTKEIATVPQTENKPASTAEKAEALLTETLPKVIEALEKLVVDAGKAIEQKPALKEEVAQAATFVKALQQKVDPASAVDVSAKVEKLLESLGGKQIQLTVAPKAEMEETAKQVEAVSSEQGKDVVTAVAGPSQPEAGQSDGEPAGDSAPDAKELPAVSLRGEAKENQEGATASGKEQKKAAEGVTENAPSAMAKTTVQSPLNPVQNPQGFQDALNAIKDGVEAKGQLQSRIMDQVVESVKSNLTLDDGKSEMIMKLKPESLGNVSLKVSIEKGIVLAEFQVENQAVKQALESNLQDLRNALQDKGFNVFDLDVSVRKDNKDNGQQNGQARNGRSKIASIAGVQGRAMEQRLVSLESVQRESTIDYLG